MILADQLKYANSYITKAINLLDENPTEDALCDVLQHCKALDEYYKKWCAEQDEAYGDPKGTSYKDGVSMEFYIEAEFWHEISLALRELE